MLELHQTLVGAELSTVLKEWRVLIEFSPALSVGRTWHILSQWWAYCQI